MFRDLFGFSIDVEDFKCMSAIGKKHAEYLKRDMQQPLSSDVFLTHFKPSGGLKVFLESV